MKKIFTNESPLDFKSKFIFINKRHKNARIPTPAHEGDVGFDLYSLDETDSWIETHSVCTFRTGIYLADTPEPLVVNGSICAVPFLKIEGRSGLASKGIFPVGGIIDPTYRGEISVILFNSRSIAVSIDIEKPIAQLVIYYTCSSMPPSHFVKFVEIDESSETERGSDGFGSTDIK